MLETIDSAIKLFGKTIRLGSNPYGDAVIASRIEASADYHDGHDCTTSDGNLFFSKQGKNCGTEICSRGEPTDDSQGGESSSISTLEVSKTQSTTTENPRTLSDAKDCSSQDHAQKEDHSDQTSSNQSEAQNPPKKPDEILPCPRCKSMDTKFCYFNNYNLNQPRHFCKNCQRYWTAGGTMRNVPVGSGRRKNKNSFLSGSQPSHIVIHEAPSGLTHQAMMPDMRVFGSQSSASTLNRGGNSSSSSLDGLVRPKMRIPAPCGLSGNQGIEASKGLIPPQMACFPGSPWPYAWNPIPWQSGCPLPFYVAPPQWICNPPAQPWNLHLLPNPSTCPDPNSSLGKRSRDGSMLVPSNFTNKKLANEQRSDNQTPQVLMPKTLRIIDDPIEVARSSVCGSLAMQKDKGRSSNIGGQIFGGFHPYKDVNPQRVNATAEGSHIVTQTNPAAFSRSLSFHEIGQ